MSVASCTVEHVAFLLGGFTWNMRIAPTTIKRVSQRNLNEQLEQDPSDWPWAIPPPAPIRAPMTDSSVVFEASSGPFVTL